MVLESWRPTSSCHDDARRRHCCPWQLQVPGKGVRLSQRPIWKDLCATTTIQSLPQPVQQDRVKFPIDQQEFIDNMKVMDFKDLGDDQNRPLTPAETSTLRSILGGLLWIIATRLDLVADVGILQSRVTKATVQDLHLANAIVKKAKMAQYRGVGIVYKHFPTTSSWRLVAVHDASSASIRARPTLKRAS